MKFSFFDKISLFKKRKFLYPSLKPRERYTKILQEFVLPELIEHGFRFVKSSPSFKKDVGDLLWEISFQASKWNSGNDVCIIRPIFSISSKAYEKWQMKNYGQCDYSMIASTGARIQFEGWNNPFSPSDMVNDYAALDYDFAKYDNVDLVNNLTENIIAIGLPFFNQASNFDGFKNLVIGENDLSMAPRLLDMSQFMDKPQEFQNIINWINSEDEGLSEWLNEEIDMRIKKFQSNNL